MIRGIWLICGPMPHVIERCLLVLLDEPERQREPVNPHGETGRYGCGV